MGKLRIGEILLAGFVATAAMTLIVYDGICNNVPVPDVASVLGGAVSCAAPPPFTWLWWLGFADHIILGTLFLPFAYAYVFRPRLGDHPILNGLGWGIVVWMARELLVGPFSYYQIPSSNPLLTNVASVTCSLWANLAYGVVLSWTLDYCHREPARRPSEARRRPLPA